MFGEFKEVMTKEFEMTDIGLMAYYLGIEVNQREDGSFISQAGYVREILKKFRMDNSKSINTPVECGVKLSKHDEEEKVDPTFFKSLVGSLRYLTCTRPDILYAVGLVSRYMEDPTTTHLKIAKRILRYIKDGTQAREQASNTSLSLLPVFLDASQRKQATVSLQLRPNPYSPIDARTLPLNPLSSSSSAQHEQRLHHPALHKATYCSNTDNRAWKTYVFPSREKNNQRPEGKCKCKRKRSCLT
ncbi:hypothetical protein ZIOFF_057288 [Zingiber officinale]|uniref:Reverse transcriptase Ty1/copia-type domain-containing protein n=1 Tax=Zingiber officinale TaxID=94328 RepID=A0A8J5F7F0_ZINOF|nr:hypothetical protein ZIOFF_057288 [Zingiber officinale]